MIHGYQNSIYHQCTTTKKKEILKQKPLSCTSRVEFIVTSWFTYFCWPSRQILSARGHNWLGILVLIYFFLELQIFNFFQYLVLLVQICKRELPKAYVHGGMVHVYLKPLMPLKFQYVIRKVHLGTRNLCLFIFYITLVFACIFLSIGSLKRWNNFHECFCIANRFPLWCSIIWVLFYWNNFCLILVSFLFFFSLLYIFSLWSLCLNL